MSAADRSPVDAVTILTAIARLLRATPHGSPTDPEVQRLARDLEDTASAVALATSARPQQLEDAALFADGQWERDLARILYGTAAVDDTLTRLAALSQDTAVTVLLSRLTPEMSDTDVVKQLRRDRTTPTALSDLENQIILGQITLPGRSADESRYLVRKAKPDSDL